MFIALLLCEHSQGLSIVHEIVIYFMYKWGEGFEQLALGQMAPLGLFQPFKGLLRFIFPRKGLRD